MRTQGHPLPETFFHTTVSEGSVIIKALVHQTENTRLLLVDCCTCIVLACQGVGLSLFSRPQNPGTKKKKLCTFGALINVPTTAIFSLHVEHSNDILLFVCYF